MARSLREAERALYEEVFGLPAYSDCSPGEHHATVFASMALHRGSVLDAGCGSGKGMVALHQQGYSPFGCDVTLSGVIPEARGFPAVEASLWHDLFPVAYLAYAAGVIQPPAQKFNYVYCCDVLEHVPPVFTMLVVRNLLAVAEHGVFLSIAFTPDEFGVWFGQSLHRTVRRYDEWLHDLQELGSVLDARDLGHYGLFWLVP